MSQKPPRRPPAKRSSTVRASSNRQPMKKFYAALGVIVIAGAAAIAYAASRPKQAVTVIDPFSNRIVFAEANAPGETPVDAEPRPAEAAAPIVLHLWVAGPPQLSTAAAAATA